MTTKAGTISRKPELVGTSSLGYDDARERALERAHKTLRHIKCFEVTGQRGRLVDGAIEFQVEVEVGFCPGGYAGVSGVLASASGDTERLEPRCWLLLSRAS